MAENKKSGLAEKWDGLKKEFSKIAWLDSNTISKQSTAVIAVSVVVAVLIVLFDAIINYGVDFLINL